jgi:hypothetical protein
VRHPNIIGTSEAPPRAALLLAADPRPVRTRVGNIPHPEDLAARAPEADVRAARAAELGRAGLPQGGVDAVDVGYARAPGYADAGR